MKTTVITILCSGSGADLLPVLEPVPLPAADVRAGDALRQLGHPRPHQGAAHPLHDLRSHLISQYFQLTKRLFND